ncbi:MAG: FMN-binding protein [Spirochaetales bacterium]|nr:FMN-binding protein [Spirochaetales bacterium]
MKKGILYTVLFTLVISFTFVLLLSTANQLTKERTKKNEELLLRKAVLNAFHIPFANDQEAYTVYDDNVTVVKKAGTDLFMHEKEGITTYAILFMGNALWGQVRGILAVNAEVTVIKGVEFISHNETPGLGGRIDEDAYKNQLRGEVVGAGGLIKGTRKGVYDYDHQNGEIDGISGATRTSESIEKIINSELKYLRKLLG